ncbi:holo-ACP synthase, partial [Rhodococcus hoagii]|nr:holo-ACP synthase [Prescottella equi]
MAVLGIGFDVVTISEFEEQMKRPAPRCCRAPTGRASYCESR